ncbi:hypothetical protein CCACVL1_02885 [Corchorus capsularis]|uniref:Uncharacterized protein n=1 Tax=Corchorus capsularis TaxID=210143 RepID=A0A1R3K542_COCAP|nr:hypothetical protein CCACVL1_02885 [Corchorus capsularis]
MAQACHPGRKTALGYWIVRILVFMTSDLIV